MKNSAVSILLLGFIFFCLSSIGFSQSIEEILQKNAQQESPASASVDNSPNRENPFFAIQAGAFQDENNAENMVIELKNAGYDPYIFQTLNTTGQTIFAVRVGRFSDYHSADSLASQLSKDAQISSIITYYDSLNTVSKGDIPTTSTQVVMAQPQAFESKDEAEMVSSDIGQTDTETPAKPESLQDRIQALESAIEKLQAQAGIREQLKITEEEAKESEEDILEAAGREYVLTNAGNIKFSYGFGYSYSEYDAIRESVRVEDVANHTISNSFSVSYGVKDNLTVGTGIPFVYKYHKVGTIDSKDVNDLGDLNLSWQFQPIKSTKDLPTIILNGGFGIPVGRSPYEIQVGEELSTSSGLYDASIGVSVSQVSDPVIVFGSFSASYPFELTGIDQKRPEGVLDEVDPGIGLGVGMGLGYALSYKLNLNMSFGYSYSFETEYKFKNAQTASSGTGTSANMHIGAGYKLSRTQNLNFSIGIPITESGQFSFSFSTPIEFEL